MTSITNKSVLGQTARGLAVLAACCFLGLPCQAAVSVEQLRCEYRTAPLGLDVAKPRLSWVIKDDERGQKQTAYQVLVASKPELLAKDQGDRWDSGKVASDQQNQIVYNGQQLTSGTACYWKVRIWDQDGKPGEWSQPNSWTMGLLQPTDWQAQWIGVNQPPPPPQPALTIILAVVTGPAGAPQVDVTALLEKLIKDHRLVARSDEHTLGLPTATDPKLKRTVTVNYELDGLPQAPVVLEVSKRGQPLILNPAPEWATPRYLRKPFTVGSPVRRATVYATALGLYELRLNGQRVGDQPLAPEWTSYYKHVQVQTYDVTAQVRAGQNVLAATLGNGWYCGGWQHWKPKLKSMYGTEPYFLAQLEIECADGTRQRVVTDATWHGTVDGPLRFAGIYEGSTYDATKELPGWDRPDYNDAAWAQAQPAPADLKVGQLVWQRNEPIRRTREIKPVAVNEVKPGVYVFAFDQNIVGWTRFSFRGQPGQTVELQHGEMRNPDGTVFLGNLLVVLKHQIQLDRYTFRTDQVETHEPRFTYHGFQYVEVRGLTAKPDLASLTGVVANSDCPEVGQFTCSEPLLNRLAENILWSQRGNFQGVPTDCPQRNERCGYTGDANFFMRTAVYNMDVGAFFNKWLVDVCEDAQMPDGHFADHAPTFGPGDGPNVGWCDAGIICPFEIYRTYGDTRVIRDHYAAMKRKLDYLTRNSTDGLFTGKIGNGDWLSNQGGVDKQVMGTAYAAFNFKQMAEMAAAIGETADAAAFRSQAEKISTAFAAAYIDADGRIKNSSQSGYALAFTMGLVPESRKAAMSERFAEEMQKFKFHPRTGFVGTPRLLPGLHEAGQDDAAYKTLLTKTAPSWLYPVTVGATTIWEQWVGWDGKTPKPGMNSLNHYSFGAVGEYLYGMVGGIQPDAPGYQKIKIAPVIREGLTWANTRYDSIRGRIVSNWKREGDKLTMAVTIPANTTATIYVPTKDAAGVMESDKPAAKADGVKFLRMENGAAVYEVGSGKYHFQTAVPDVKGAGVDKTATEIAKPPAKPPAKPASEPVKKTVESQSVQVPVGKVKTQQPLVALTFDDGPDPLTLKLLDLLKTRNVKATFFVVGIKVKTLPDIVKRMIAEGHEVGNHSKTHSWLHKNPDPGAVRADIESTQQILKDTIGSEPRLYRAPYLGYSSNVWAVLKDHKMTAINGQLCQDWDKNITAAMIVEKATKNTSSGDIIILHTGQSNTVDALPEIIDKLEGKGLRIVTVSELMASEGK